jgi:hypothetical protein
MSKPAPNKPFSITPEEMRTVVRVRGLNMDRAVDERPRDEQGRTGGEQDVSSTAANEVPGHQPAEGQSP